MKKETFDVVHDGFYGAYYPNKEATSTVMILMLGDSIDDRMAVSGVKWIHSFGCNALTMAPAKKDYGHHNYPLERFGKALDRLREKGNQKFGIAGASTTAMLALCVASYYPEITLTITISPCDFIMEGFYRDGKDGMRERPGQGESTVSWKGQPLPYLPYAYRHPTYWKMIRKESKEGKDMVASRKLFDESERRHPLQESQKIKVEKIRGHIVFIGGYDDVLWDTCRYIKRMERRLEDHAHTCTITSLLYAHVTHFAFPQSMLDRMLPIFGNQIVKLFAAGRAWPKQCKQARKDIDKNLTEIIQTWK